MGHGKVRNLCKRLVGFCYKWPLNCRPDASTFLSLPCVDRAVFIMQVNSKLYVAPHTVPTMHTYFTTEITPNFLGTKVIMVKSLCWLQWTLQGKGKQGNNGYKLENMGDLESKYKQGMLESSQARWSSHPAQITSAKPLFCHHSHSMYVTKELAH